MHELPPDDRFRAFFDPDPDRAREQFRVLFSKLERYFAWNHCAGAEELADETIYRAWKRISEGAEIYTDLTSYCRGIAANVLKEKRKRRPEEEISLDPPAPGDAPAGQLNSTELSLLVEQYLNLLPPAQRSLVYEYYWGDRHALAIREKLTANALRIRICRILKGLRTRTDKDDHNPEAQP